MQDEKAPGTNSSLSLAQLRGDGSVVAQPRALLAGSGYDPLFGSGRNPTSGLCLLHALSLQPVVPLPLTFLTLARNFRCCWQATPCILNIIPEVFLGKI